MFFNAFDFLYINLAMIIYWLLFVTFGISKTFDGREWTSEKVTARLQCVAQQWTREGKQALR